MQGNLVYHQPLVSGLWPRSAKVSCASAASKWASHGCTQLVVEAQNRVLCGACRKRGWAYYELGEYDKAMADAWAALDIEGGDVDAFSLLAEACSALGQWEDAVEAQQQVVALEPHSRECELELLVKQVDLAAFKERDLQAVVDLASQGVQQAQELHVSSFLPEFLRCLPTSHVIPLMLLSVSTVESERGCSRV